MHSRLTLVSKLNKILFTTTPKYKTIQPRPLFSTSSGDNTEAAEGDDAMTQGVDTEGETANPKPDNEENIIISTKEDNHYKHPKTLPPNLSSPKLQNPGVCPPVDPHFQQKRTKFTGPTQELSCVGPDGSPLSKDDKDKDIVDSKEEVEDDIEYFKHHKASPLSEIEIAETKKPLERVMHGTADGYFGDEKVLTWKPEQLDTAEESLLRAAEMFKEAAAKGVPDWPHSRRLRELRGEDW